MVEIVGDDQPLYFIAEAGVNHNGSVDLALRLVDLAADCSADAVKFQKRTVRDILVAASGITPEVAALQLGERTDLSDSVIGDRQRATLTETGAVLQRIGLIDAGVDIPALVDSLIDPQYVRRVVALAEPAQ